MSDPIRFIMIGGFLGAGKTTLIARLAKKFRQDGKHVCIVTNDQAAGLVDTELLKSQGLEVNEVAGSCFCCNYSGLTEAMNEFESRRRPDIILAEPVGSCTDLIATIAIPMMEQLGEKFIHSPYSVLLKPKHGLKILSGVGGGFSEKAEYIFRKQLEESEIILLNRIDELSAGELSELKSLVADQYPGREVICLSAKTGENIDEYYAALKRTASPRSTTMEVDYDVYADGEAELGWLNATASFIAQTPVSLDQIANDLVEHLRQELARVQAEPGHLKVLCSSDGNVSVANLVDSDSATVLSVSSDSETKSCVAIINARVRLEPETLSALVRATVDTVAARIDASVTIEQLESFRPGRPTPTFRVQR